MYPVVRVYDVNFYSISKQKNASTFTLTCIIPFEMVSMLSFFSNIFAVHVVVSIQWTDTVASKVSTLN